MGLRSFVIALAVKRARLVMGAGMAALAWHCASHQRLVRQDEGVILADVRAVLSAQASYQAGNGGFYGSLACLAAPSDCIPGYPKHAPVFLGKTLAELRPENGYARRFYPGPPPPGPMPPSIVGPDSLTSWAYTAFPASDRRGRKSFCTDHTGRICAGLDGSEPKVVDANCPSPCERVK